MKTQLTAIVAMAAFVTTAGVALAQGDTEPGERRLHRGAGMHHSGDPGRMLDHLDRKLELDDAQRQRLEDAVAAVRPEMEALRQRSEQNRKALRELEVSHDGYEATLADLAREKGDVAAQMTLLHGRLRAEVDAVLTPEQRQKMTAAGERKGRHHKGKHRRWRNR